MDYFTNSNKMLSLREPALKSGGEGAVYDIIGYNNVVAKIYFSMTDAKQREKKITEMANLSLTEGFKNSQLLNDVAWPLVPLFNKSKEFVGFVMSRIEAKYELDNVYSLNSKTNAGMSTADKVVILISLCDVVDRLHKRGQVIGDFNSNNIKVDNKGNVKLVDVDSYHFKSGKTVYPCMVCAPGYIAPELIKKCRGSTYEEVFEKGGITFTEETDRFALAIHCFRMLMNGCHPFTCKKNAQNVGSTPVPSVDKRVEKGETPFFTTVTNFTTPDWAPDVTSLPTYIRELFMRAFVDGYKNPSLRPTAKEWSNALKKYQHDIVNCRVESRHWYWKQLNTCPYCVASERGKKNFIASMTPVARNNSNVNRGTVTTPNKISTTCTYTNTNKISTTCTYTNTNKVPTTCTHTNTSNSISQKPHTVVKKKPFSTLSADSEAYWCITMVLAMIMHIILGIYIYAPLYLIATGYEWVMWVGAVGSGIAGVVGTYCYNEYWSEAALSYPYILKWYDYFLALLTGVGFAIGFAISLATVALAVVGVFYILAIIFILLLLVGLCSG